MKQYKANSVFIATDDDPYISVIEEQLKTLKRTVSVSFFKKCTKGRVLALHEFTAKRTLLFVPDKLLMISSIIQH